MRKSLILIRVEAANGKKYRYTTSKFTTKSTAELNILKPIKEGLMIVWLSSN